MKFLNRSREVVTGRWKVFDVTVEWKRQKCVERQGGRMRRVVPYIQFNSPVQRYNLHGLRTRQVGIVFMTFFAVALNNFRRWPNRLEKM